MAPKKVDGSSPQPIDHNRSQLNKEKQSIQEISSSSLQNTPKKEKIPTKIDTSKWEILATPLLYEEPSFDPEKDSPEWEIDAEFYEGAENRTLSMPGDKKPEPYAQSTSRTNHIAITFFFLMKPFMG
ncbi:MAG TPA: hypothetical protein PLO43_00240 [Chlamydiales bacterium]|nr:hypothetical protein [Chlamydiales bacterium]HPE84594.1 hypothetical protein [Chlamydiales bacterium]